MQRMRSAIPMLLGLAACGPRVASHGFSAIDSAPMQLVGERCRDGACTCRPVDNLGRGDRTDEGTVAAGEKRFELRTGRGLDELTVTVEGRGTFTKPVDGAAGACAYLDLPPGKHHVRLRVRAAKPEEGMVPALLLNEYSTRTHDWYDTFRFKCGEPDACTKDDVEAWGQRQEKVARGILDPCGSTSVEQVRWQVEHSPEVRVLDLTLDFVLHVYQFTPRFRHGGECRGLAGSVPDENAP
jgi:hypothetical protein